MRILSEFAVILKKNDNRGRIINESEPSQDTFLIYAHNRLQSDGTGDGKLNGSEYRNIVTSLSLVNKLNQDIDVQIADMLAITAGYKYKIERQITKRKLTVVEKMKYQVIEKNCLIKNQIFLLKI